MANRLFASVLLVVLLLTSSPPSFSSARLLNDFNLPATELTFNLVLPGADKGVGAVVNNEPAVHVLPCDMVAAGKPSSEMRVPAVATPRRAGKYGSLLLNMLPKGSVPPSAPSKGTNNINN